MDNQNMSQERPLAIAAGAPYFQNIPLGFLVAFAWFCYLAISSLSGLVTMLNLFPLWSNPNVMEYFLRTPTAWYFLIPAVDGLLAIAVAWGLIKQVPWTRPMAWAWYIVYLAFVAFM